MKQPAAAAWAAVALLAGAAAHPQSRQDVDVQRARDVFLKERGKTSYYTERWNLDDLPEYRPEQKVSGNIRIWGLNYLADCNLARFWEEGFRKYHPESRIAWYTPTALVALPGLYTGQADIGASREITFDETLTFQRIFYYLPLEISMVTGSYDVPGWANALAIFVHKDNPIAKVTFRQLDGLFGAARRGGYDGTTWHPDRARGPEGNIRTWGQLGLTGEWKDKPINVYGLNLKYHQQLRLERRVFGGGSMWNENLREYSNYARADGTLATAAGELMKDLSQDRYGIAYSGIQNATPQTKLLAVAEKDGGPFVELTRENVRNRSYPLYGEEYWYVNRRPGSPLDPKVKEFLRYVLSREGQDAVQRDAHYLPLTGEVAREQLRKLE
jgi:phosphate transport system substrate-binding protein